MLLLLACQGLFLTALSGGITTGPIPKWVIPIKPDINATVASTQIGDGYYFLLYDVQTDVSSRASFSHYVKKITNQSGVENCGQLEFPFNRAFENVIIHQIYIVRNGQYINKLNISKLRIAQVDEDADTHEYHERMKGLYFVDDLRAGDIIEYSYTLVKSNPLFAKYYFSNVSLQFSEPLCHLFNRILIPDDRKLYFKSLFGGRMPDEKTENGLRTYQWDLTNISALREDDMLPVGYDPYASVDVSEYSSWLEVKNWAADMYKPVMVSGPRVKAKAADISRSHQRPEDRIMAAVRFVQQDIRYLGIETGLNTHLPHPPEQVMQLGWGDCKDKAVLLCCLLHEMGITAYPVLINTEATDDMPERLPSPNIFDHLCAAVEYGHRYYYFDPTISYQRGNMETSVFPNYKFGLIITDTSKTLVSIPFNDSTSTTTMIDEFGLGDTLAPATLKVTTIYTGSEADDFREKLATRSLQARQKDYVNFYTRIYKDIDVIDSLVVTADDSLENKIITTELYTIKKLWNYNEKKSRWEVGVTADNLGDLLNRPKIQKRIMPIGITYPQNYTEKIIVKLPGEFNLEDDQGLVEDTAIRFSYYSHYESNKLTETIVYHLQSKRDNNPAGENKRYLSDIDKILGENGETIFYSATRDNTGSGSRSFFMIFLFILTWVAGYYVARRVYMEYDIETDFTSQAPAPFKGVIWLPVILISLLPLMLLSGIISSGLFDQNSTDIIFNRFASNYNPSLGAVLITRLILYSIPFLLSCLALVLMYRKRSVFPRIFTLLVRMLFVVFLLDISLKSIATNSLHINGEQMYNGTVFLLLFLFYVWFLPYFKLSERVRQTFTNRNGKPKY